MYPRLDTAPAYLWIALLSVVFTVVVAVWQATLGDDVTQSSGNAAFAGVLFGCVMGPWTAHRRREEHDVEGRIAPEDLVTARRWSAYGPLPRTEKVRATTTTLVEYRLRHAQTHRRSSTLAFTATAAACAVFANWHPEWWVTTAAMLFLAGHAAYEPTRLTRRLAALRAPRVKTSAPAEPELTHTDWAALRDEDDGG